MVNSVLFAGFTTLFAAVFGIVVFMGAHGLPSRCQRILSVAAFSCLLLPPFLQAGAWFDLGLKLSLPVATIPFGAAVLALQLWPVVMLLLLAASKRLEPSLLEAARLSLSVGQLWMRVILPLLSPALGLGCVLIFILALNNFIIPTTFQTSVQITEVYVMFSSLYQTDSALLQSFPLWMVSMVALAVAIRLTTHISVGKANRHTGTGNTKALQQTPLPYGRVPWLLLSLALFTLALFPPFSRIITACCRERVWTTLQLARPQFEASLAYAFGCAALTTVIATGLWFFTSKWKLEWVLATPFVLSGFFLGVLLIAINQWAGKWAWWQGTWMLGIAALTIRFIWIPYKAAETAHQQIGLELLDAAKVFRLPPRSILRFIEWPALFPSLSAAAWLVYILALWDVETLVMIYPPGGEPVSLKIYQLLHYGYDAQVGVLSLGLLLMGIAPGLLGWMVWKAIRF